AVPHRTSLALVHVCPPPPPPRPPSPPRRSPDLPREPRRRDEAPGHLAVQPRHIRYRNLGRAFARHQGDSQPCRSAHARRRVLPHDRALGRRGVWLAAPVPQLETGLLELVRSLLQ